MSSVKVGSHGMCMLKWVLQSYQILMSALRGAFHEVMCPIQLGDCLTDISSEMSFVWSSEYALVKSANFRQLDSAANFCIFLYPSELLAS